MMIGLFLDDRLLPAILSAAKDFARSSARKPVISGRQHTSFDLIVLESPWKRRLDFTGTIMVQAREGWLAAVTRGGPREILRCAQDDEIGTLTPADLLNALETNKPAQHRFLTVNGA